MIKLLKPCPFCGGDAELDTRKWFKSGTGKIEEGIAVYCLQCPAEISIFMADVPDIDDETIASLWNARVICLC